MRHESSASVGREAPPIPGITAVTGKAVEALRSGRPVLIYDADGREEETDIAYASEFVTPGAVRRLRKDGGGLVCTTFTHEGGEKLGLPYLSELFYKEGGRYPVLKELIPNDIPYDEGSSFSITINHRQTFEGKIRGSVQGAGQCTSASLLGGSPHKAAGSYRTGQYALHHGGAPPVSHHLRDDGGRRELPVQGKG